MDGLFEVVIFVRLSLALGHQYENRRTSEYHATIIVPIPTQLY
jgi:hypothetical protein